MNETLLGTLIHEYYTAQRIYDWDFKETSDRIRLYYKPIGTRDKGGFYFYGVEATGNYHNPDGEDEVWHPERTFAECFYKGVAFFDGIRHLYLGANETDNYGYHYYPELTDHIKFLTALKELEDKYCRKD